MIIPIVMITFFVAAEVLYALKYQKRSGGIFYAWTRGSPDPEKAKKLEEDLAKKSKKGGPFISPIRTIRDTFFGDDAQSSSKSLAPRTNSDAAANATAPIDEDDAESEVFQGNKRTISDGANFGTKTREKKLQKREDQLTDSDSGEQDPLIQVSGSSSDEAKNGFFGISFPNMMGGKSKKKSNDQQKKKKRGGTISKIEQFRIIETFSLKDDFERVEQCLFYRIVPPDLFLNSP